MTGTRSEPGEQVPSRSSWWTAQTAILLLANAIAYAAVNAFWHYLSTGRWVDVSLSSYRRALPLFLGPLFQPSLRVFVHPGMVPVVGLLLGAMIFVPVILAVRRTTVLALLMAVVMIAVGHTFVLALAVALGAVLAAGVRRTTHLPLIAAAVGIVPPAVTILAFFALFVLESTALLPLQRWVLTVPLLIGIGSALLACGVTLALGRVPGLRRVTETVVLVFMLAGPVSWFYASVGADKLAYRRLIPEGGDAIFQPASLEQWHERHGTVGLAGEALLHPPRDRLIDRCSRFLASYPDSSRAPSVLWIKARCRSLQLDRRALEAGQVRPVGSYVLSSSRGAWEQLLADHPSARQAILARCRLAELALRRGELQLGDRLLQTARLELGEYLRQPGPAARSEPQGLAFAPSPSLPSRAQYADVQFRVEKLTWLMESNRVLTDPNAAAALVDYLNVNPHADARLDSLQARAERHAGTPLASNWALLLAERNDDLYRRARAIQRVAEGWREDPDAAMEASYELGLLTLREPILRLLPGIDGPQAYFRRVQEGPPNPWHELAAQRLEILQSRGDREP